MNLTLNVHLPDQDQEAIARIDDLEARVAWFVREQIALERWRGSRQAEVDRDIALDAIRQAETWRQSGVSREQVAERFLRRWDEIMTGIGS